MNKTVDRIRKLLNMARDAGASENERETADRMAKAMMEAAGIVMEDLTEDGELDPISTVGKESNLDGRIVWKSIIGVAVVRLLGMDAYVAGDLTWWVGTAAQRESAAALREYLYAQVERLSKALEKTMKANHGKVDRGIINDYRKGIASGIAKRVREIVEYRETQTNSAYAITRQDQVMDAIKKLMPPTEEVVRTNRASAAYEAGKQDAKSIVIQPQAKGSETLRLKEGE